MGATKQQILNYLEMRYDYLSARNVYNEWLGLAGLREDPDPLNDDQIRALLEYLRQNAADATRVHNALMRLLGVEVAAMPSVSQPEPVQEEPALTANVGEPDIFVDEHENDVFYQEPVADDFVDENPETIENTSDNDVIPEEMLEGLDFEALDNAENLDNGEFGGKKKKKKNTK